jgi:hypothetical protein
MSRSFHLLEEPAWPFPQERAKALKDEIEAHFSSKLSPRVRDKR